MMKRSVGLWQLMGFAVTSLGGTVLHFLYEWLGEAIWVAPFSGVNESTWEHMKILFFPMLIFACIQSGFFKKDYPNFWWVKLLGITLGTILIPVLFYTLNGAFGKTPSWVNIALFFLSAICAYFVEWLAFRKQGAAGKASFIPIIILLLIAAAFVFFTFAPPKLPLFQDPPLLFLLEHG